MPAAIHQERARMPIRAKNARDGLNVTSTDGHAQRTPPAIAAVTHMSVFPNRIWPGVLGKRTMRARIGHIQTTGRHHQRTYPITPSGIAHQRTSGSTTNGMKRYRAWGGYRLSTSVCTWYGPDS